MATEIEAARLLVYQAASLLSHGKLPFKEAAMAKLYACEMAARVSSEAVHIHGALRIHERMSGRTIFPGRAVSDDYQRTDGKTQLIIAGQIGLFWRRKRPHVLIKNKQRLRFSLSTKGKENISWRGFNTNRWRRCARSRTPICERWENFCFRGHPHDSRKFRELGLQPSDIATVDDLDCLPLTTKKDYLCDPEAFRLDIPELPLSERIIWDVMFTAGTSTGKPVPFYSTTHDFYSILYSNRENGLRHQGV